MSTMELEIQFLHFWHIISNDYEYQDIMQKC